MKRVIYFFTIITIFASCSNEENLSKNREANSLKNKVEINQKYIEGEVENIGVLHNECVDYIFNRMESDGVRLFSQPCEQMKQVINQYAIEFVSSIYDINEIESIILGEVGNPREHLSAEANYIVDRIMEIFLETDLQYIEPEFSQLKEEIYVLINDNLEEAMLLSTISIAEHTINYWSDFGNRWQNLLDENLNYVSDINEYGLSARHVGRTDVDAGWQAGGGYIILAWGGPVTWTAFFGTILVSAAIASAWTAINATYAIVIDAIEPDYYEFSIQGSPYFEYINSLYRQNPTHSYFDEENGKFYQYIGLFY